MKYFLLFVNYPRLLYVIMFSLCIHVLLGVFGKILHAGYVGIGIGIGITVIGVGHPTPSLPVCWNLTGLCLSQFWLMQGVKGGNILRPIAFGSTELCNFIIQFCQFNLQYAFWAVCKVGSESVMNFGIQPNYS
jgi:hypothetical protein